MDGPRASAEAIRPLVSGSVLWLPRGLELLGATLALIGIPLTWATRVGIAGVFDYVRGYETAAGWIVVAAAIVTLVFQAKLAGLALNAIPAMAGGIAIYIWASSFDTYSFPDNGQELGNDFLVSFVGCGFIGAGGLIALGMLLGLRMRDEG